MKYQNFTTGSGHILIPFIIGIGAGWGNIKNIIWVKNYEYEDTIADIFGRYARPFW